MPPIEVIYENGVLRPLRPLDLPDGTRFVATLTEIGVPPDGQMLAEVDEAEYLALIKELDRIAALPLEGAPSPHAARDHDAILYPSK